MVAGLSIGRRIALAAVRARACARAEDAEAGRRRLVLIPSNVIPQVQWLRALREMPLESETLWVDPTLVAVVETGDPESVLAAAARAASPAELVSALSGRFKIVEAPANAKGRFAVHTAATCGPRSPGCFAASSRTARASCRATSSGASRWR